MKGLWYGSTVEHDWVRPEATGGREDALLYAARSYARHEAVARRAQLGFILFQAVTIVSAATATVLNVAASVSDLARAVPSAIATLGAAVSATFHFRATWTRHRAAGRTIEFERLNFHVGAGQYVDGTEQEKVNRFLAAVYKATADADPEMTEP